MCAARMPDPDVVIVGSGIAGALIAKVLATAGKKVLILEAGEQLPPDINGYMNRFLNATAKVPESPYPPELFDANGLVDPSTVNVGRPTVLSLGARYRFGDWQDPKQSYLIQQGPLPFASTYERINGGTSRHWLGTSLRFLPSDFEMKTRYNRFVDWPIKYSHLEEWYGKAEREIGVSADVADQSYLDISFSSGYSYPMPKIVMSKVDAAVEAGLSGLKISGHGLDDVKWAVASTPAARNSQPYQNRRVCAGNTNCIPICPIQAKYDPSVTLADALRTGRVDIMYKTVASKVQVDESRRVSGIEWIRYQDEKGPPVERGSVTGNKKVYILAGNAIETPRLLLMSKSERSPDGVANRKDGKGFVGKYLMDHPLYLAWALAPKPVWGYRGPLSTAGIEICRDGAFRRDRGAFRVEIGNEGWNFALGDPNTTTVDFVNGINFSGLNGGKSDDPKKGEPKALFGSELTAALNDKLSRQFRLGFLIEQSPDAGNKVTVSDQFMDHLGLQRPQISYNLSEYTKQGLAAAKDTASAIFKNMGADEFTTKPNADDPSTFEWPQGSTERIKYYGAGHLVGTHRMGTSANDSVVDDMQRSWDHKNLYLVGSGSFPTVATANPTLTLAALCLRTADDIVKNFPAQ
ncbi:choline dehydrogenase-like flavoprotein [Bradyrhizobium sp. LA6.1]|uniref:GMC family oxidoreductase n=1 Tax=Bradyrhizobium sp. LA6.1 TaxID=3156378 RepID=UPI0033992903